MTAQAADIFLSYKAEDRTRVQPLVSGLEAEGFTVWWDANIGGGSNWQEDIEQHLQAARCVIVAWSKRSIGRGGQFVRDEARHAQRRGAYLPVCLDGVEPPLGFGEIQAISLKGWKGDRSDKRFRQIADAVGSRISGARVARPQTVSRGPRLSRRTLIAGGAGVAAVAAAGGGWVLLKPVAANAKRIAVLPFANLSGAADQAYFAEGIAEELRAALARIGLEVIGRTSSDAVKDMDAKAAASKLDVANILTGSVRRSPEMIRINAQLLSGNDGVERWSESYDRAPGDAIKIQTDIAENVAQALSIALGSAARAALTLGGTSDPVAQDLVLQARQTLENATSPADLSRAIAFADAAIARDPRYADAYIAKAQVHHNWADSAPTSNEAAEQLAQAEPAIQKAIALAPGWATPYVALSMIEALRLDFARSLSMARRAVALAPQEAAVVGIAAGTVAYLENPLAGLRLVDRAIALDPLRAPLYGAKAIILVFARQYREAIEVARKARSLSPNGKGGGLPMGDAFLLLGQPAEAKAAYETIPNNIAFHDTRLVLLAARTGDRAGALKGVAEIKRDTGAANSYQIAETYAQLGDREQAFAELDAALERRDGGLAFLKFDPFLDPIRGDPRYAALLRRLNFPV